MAGAKPGQDVDVDLGRLFKAIWEKRLRLLMVTAAVAVVALVGVKMIAPQYQAETQVLIELRTPDFAEKVQPANNNSDPILDDLGIVSQVQVLQSTDLIKKVARDLKLYEQDEFDPASNPSFLKKVLISFGVVKNPLDTSPEERVLKEFRQKLQVYQVEKSRVIGIQFTSRDPALAAEVPNKMAAAYLAMQSGAKLDTDSEAARWLEPEIATLRDKVRQAEQKVADYRATNGLLRTGGEQTLAGQQLNDISAELAKVRGDLANANARAEAVRQALNSGGSVDTLSDVISSPTIQALKSQESTIQNQISDLSITLLDGHPRLKGLRAQLIGIRQQITAETRKILRSLENEANVAKLREQQLLTQLESAKQQTAHADEQQVDLNALEREAKAQRDLLETYLARYREAASRAGKDAAPADARVISTAVQPTEVHFPKVLPILIVAVLAAFLLQCVGIMLAELFSGRAWRQLDEEVPVRSALPAVATYPAATSAGSQMVKAAAGAKVADQQPSAPMHEEDANLDAEFSAAADASVHAATVDTDALEEEFAHHEDQKSSDESTPVAAALFGEATQTAASEDEDVALEAEEHDGQTGRKARAGLSDGQVEDAVVEDVTHEAAAQASSAPAQTAEAVEDDGNEFSVAAVARHLSASDKRVAACISPSGDDGSAATVELARRISSLGQRTILIDMTGSALPSRLMGENPSLPGITDILAGTSSIASCIHGDKYSEAHFIPHGTADPTRAMRGADRLTMIVGALSEAYEKVLIECGPIDARSVERLTRNDSAEIVVSMPGADEDKIARILPSFEAAGRGEVILMTDKPLPPSGGSDIQVA